MGNQEYGTGLVTAYKQLVSDQLGIDADRIDVVMGDTDRTPARADRRLARAAGRRLGAARGRRARSSTRASSSPRICWKRRPHDIDFGDGAFRIVRHRPARRSVRRREGRARSRQAARPAWSPASTPRKRSTAGADLSRTAATSSRSRSIPTPACRRSCATRSSTTSAHRSIRCCSRARCMAAIVQGIGQALLRADGLRRRRASFSPARSWTTRCRAPTTCRASRFSTHNVPCTANPLGVKGAGEAGAVGAPPAVINAIVDALHHRAGRAPHRHAGHSPPGVGDAQRQARGSPGPLSGGRCPTAEPQVHSARAPWWRARVMDARRICRDVYGNVPLPTQRRHGDATRLTTVTHKRAGCRKDSNDAAHRDRGAYAGWRPTTRIPARNAAAGCSLPTGPNISASAACATPGRVKPAVTNSRRQSSFPRPPKLDRKTAAFRKDSAPAERRERSLEPSRRRLVARIVPKRRTIAFNSI